MTQLEGTAAKAPDPAASRHVRALALSMFVSSLGTTLILVALSVHFFADGGSALAAAGVYVAQFLPVAALMPLSWAICNRYAPRNSLIVMELISAGLTLLVGLAVETDLVVLVYLLLMIRGFFDMTTKAARSVALKLVAESDRVSHGNNLVMAGSFIGQTVGSLVGFALIDRLSMSAIAVVDAATFLVSAVLCLRLPATAVKATAERSSWPAFARTGYRVLKSDHRIASAMFYLLATVILMQSFNQVARTWIPLGWLGQSKEVGALSEALGCLGIALGLVVVSLFMSGPKARGRHLPAAFLGGCVLMLTPFLSRDLATSFSFYFVYMIVFEISFMASMNQLLHNTRQDDIPGVMVLFYGGAFGGMTLVTPLIAAASDQWGLPNATILLAAAGIVFGAGLMLHMGRRAAAAPPAEAPP